MAIINDFKAIKEACDNISLELLGPKIKKSIPPGHAAFQPSRRCDKCNTPCILQPGGWLCKQCGHLDMF